jgi:catechol 2,3-dioxygenase-like lactoylglutathione lyase family enzyme
VKPRINVLTIAVNDLEKSLAFYRDGLGLPTQGIIGTEFAGSATEPSGAVAFFELQGGLIFALYPRTDLAKDANLQTGTPSATEFSIGYAVHSKEEVDILLDQAKQAGAVVTVAPHDRPWGIYAGYFQDPDGHLWEIMWNPALDIEE